MGSPNKCVVQGVFKDRNNKSPLMTRCLVCFFLFWVEAVNLLNNAIGRTRLKKVTFLLLFCKMVTVVTSPVLCTQLKPVDCIPPSSSRDSDYHMCVTCQRWTSIRCTKPALQKLIYFPHTHRKIISAGNSRYHTVFHFSAGWPHVQPSQIF